MGHHTFKLLNILSEDIDRVSQTSFEDTHREKTVFWCAIGQLMPLAYTLQSSNMSLFQKVHQISKLRAAIEPGEQNNVC